MTGRRAVKKGAAVSGILPLRRTRPDEAALPIAKTGKSTQTLG
jgi:hypothetical protein